MQVSAALLIARAIYQQYLLMKTTESEKFLRKWLVSESDCRFKADPGTINVSVRMHAVSKLITLALVV